MAGGEPAGQEKVEIPLRPSRDSAAFAAPLAVGTALVPTAGPAMAVWLDTYTAMANAMATATDLLIVAAARLIRGSRGP
ncbi:hypothetical protein BJG92_03624 [Arthrobacter sp. SO5]|nr:hypothetical protein [Arthrobacter sp. SO5]